MKLNSKHLILVSLALFIVTGCGRGKEESTDEENKKENQTNNQFINDDESVSNDQDLQNEMASAALTDAMEILSDSDISAASTSLALAPIYEDNSEAERSCDVDGDNARVEIERNIDRNWSRSGLIRTHSRAVTGQDDLTRTWSDDYHPVDCNGNYADIKWSSNLQGLELDVSFKRSRKIEVRQQNIIREFKFEATREHSAKGDRTMKILEQADDEEAETITRSIEVTSNVERSHSFANSLGKEKKADFKVLAAADTPLMIENKRSTADGSMIHKEVSGQVQVERIGDGKMVAVFDALHASFDEDGCNLDSGKVTFSLHKEGEEEPAKELELKFEDGEFTFTNLTTGEEIEGFDYENCSLSMN